MELSERAEELLESLLLAAGTTDLGWGGSAEQRDVAQPPSAVDRAHPVRPRTLGDRSQPFPVIPPAAGEDAHAHVGASCPPEDSGAEAANELLAAGLATRSGDTLTLTDSGAREAELVLRRHRLAERLLIDVLGVGDELVHQAACRFEHIIHRGIDDRICTLLGHPRFCPHGSAIPPGPCCEEALEAAQPVVTPLAAMSPGGSGRIAYIHTRERATLQKLIAMGALPGAEVSIIQTFPSFLFQVGQTQVAVDRQIADSIYVRVQQPPAPGHRAGWRGRGLRQPGRLGPRRGRGG